jgi:hypothetical protein
MIYDRCEHDDPCQWRRSFKLNSTTAGVLT